MIVPPAPGRQSLADHVRFAGIASAALLLLAIVAGVALAGPRGAPRIHTGRTYAGTISRSASDHINGGPSDPIDVSVSANGATATLLANYSPCQEPGIYFSEQAFATRSIRHGGFRSTKHFVRPDISITVTGRFLPSGRAAGTISSVTINYLYRPGRICKTSNHWTATAQPKRFHACAPHPLGDYGVAQHITDERTACTAVEKAIARGRFDPSSLPLARRAALSIPGWSCSNEDVRTPSFSCQRGNQSFEFVVFS
jgi:hypothetical protein